jgi:hypothetical protein
VGVCSRRPYTDTKGRSTVTESKTKAAETAGSKDDEDKAPKVSKAEATGKLLRALTKAAVFGSEAEARDAAVLVEILDPTPEDEGREE